MRSLLAHVLCGCCADAQNFARDPVPSATMVVGTQAATVTFQNHTRILFTLPNGQGSGQDIRVTVDGQISNTVQVRPRLRSARTAVMICDSRVQIPRRSHSFLCVSSQYTYRLPKLLSMAPRNGSTSGNTSLTLTGQEFGLSPIVSFSGVTCPVQSGGACRITSFSATQIVVQTPAGDGSNIDVSVSAGGQSSAESIKFSYLSPVIASIAPLLADTAGVTDITIKGSNFGLSPSATVAGQTCAVQSFVAHTQLVCRVPAGSGSNKAVVVSSLTQFSAPSYISELAQSLLRALLLALALLLLVAACFAHFVCCVAATQATRLRT